MLAKFLIFTTLISFAISTSNAITVYTSQPPVPQVTDLPKKTSVTKEGITWSFNKPMPVGTFITGDFYVVGSVIVTAISPKPANGRHGSMLDIRANIQRSGFDSRIGGNRYDVSLRANVPITLNPGNSLVSSISVAEGKVATTARWLFRDRMHGSPVEMVAILTCLSAPAPPDAFRPSYADRKNTIYRSSNFKRNLFPRLSGVNLSTKLQEWIDHFKYPWIDNVFFGFDAPLYMPDYGREVGRATGIAGLLLSLDIPVDKREELLVHFVQYGIDLWGLVQAGHSGWPAHGGHGQGRKLPIVFAGTLLGDYKMSRPSVSVSSTKYSEDMQTMYAKGWTGALAVYAGHVGKSGTGDKGPYEHLQPKDWNGNLGESYRRCCTSTAWVGQALAIQLVQGEKNWNHGAFFDYVDRWMTEDDTEHIKIIQQATGVWYSDRYQRQRVTRDLLVDIMWRQFRNNLPTAGIPVVPAYPDQKKLPILIPNPLSKSSLKIINSQLQFPLYITTIHGEEIGSAMFIPHQIISPGTYIVQQNHKIIQKITILK